MVDFLSFLGISGFLELMVVFALASVGFVCPYHLIIPILFNFCLFLHGLSFPVVCRDQWKSLALEGHDYIASNRTIYPIGNGPRCL